MDRAEEVIRIEVAYSPAARKVELLPLEVQDGQSVLEALRKADWFARHPELDAAAVTVGIWGRRVSLSQPLREGDRIEIYRALQVDPKEARRQRYRRQGDRGRVRRKKPELE